MVTIGKKNIIIAGLIVALMICLYLLFGHLCATEQKFDRRYKNEDAWNNIARFRRMPSGSIYSKADMIYYDVETVKEYVNEKFPAIVNELELPPNCKWVLGFYFMRTKNVNGKPRTSFFVVPTLLEISGKDTTVIDFYGDRDRYIKKTGAKILPDDSLAYDAGHMWP